MKFINGDIYEGDFNNNLIEGIGKFKYANGEIYEGDVKNAIKSGKGIMTMHNGDIYDGEFKDNKKNGFGELTYTSDNVFQMEYDNCAMMCHTFTNLLWKGTMSGTFKTFRREDRGIFQFVDVY